ncbi:MAG TPA: TSUP family transporter [Phycisphaerales bacterium]|nr:TSUP family transporter [Phycisphaerales bacterium]
MAGLGGLTGAIARLRFGRAAALAAGALSGILGGMVGNQGGIRSAALLGFGLERDRFVGTATAIALIVDATRLPICLASHGRRMLAMWDLIAVLSAAVVLGTIAGRRALAHVPPRVFQRLVSGVVLALGAAMLARAFSG